MQFQKGQSGNPAGRPPGSRNKAALAMQAMLDGEAEAIVDRLIRLAKSGDPFALKVCIDRILPRRREPPTPFRLPPVESAADLKAAYRALCEAVAAGELTVREADELGRFAAGMLANVQQAELAERVAKLEAALERLEAAPDHTGRIQGAAARAGENSAVPPDARYAPDGMPLPDNTGPIQAVPEDPQAPAVPVTPTRTRSRVYGGAYLNLPPEPPSPDHAGGLQASNG